MEFLNQNRYDGQLLDYYKNRITQLDLEEYNTMDHKHHHEHHHDINPYRG